MVASMRQQQQQQRAWLHAFSSVWLVVCLSCGGGQNAQHVLQDFACACTSLQIAEAGSMLCVNSMQPCGPRVERVCMSKVLALEVMRQICVCRDKSAQEFETYLRDMPWWAFDFERPENARLASLCQVQTIPCLVLLGPEGELITNKAADLHRADPTGAEFPYRPRAIQRLTRIAGPTLNTVPCVVAFVDGGKKGAVAHVEEVFKETPEAEFAKGAGRVAHFFLADAQSEFSQQVMQVRARGRVWWHVLPLRGIAMSRARSSCMHGVAWRCAACAACCMPLWDNVIVRACTCPFIWHVSRKH